MARIWHNSSRTIFNVFCYDTVSVEVWTFKTFLTIKMLSYLSYGKLTCLSSLGDPSRVDIWLIVQNGFIDWIKIITIISIRWKILLLSYYSYNFTCCPTLRKYYELENIILTVLFITLYYNSTIILAVGL